MRETAYQRWYMFGVGSVLLLALHFRLTDTLYALAVLIIFAAITDLRLARPPVASRGSPAKGAGESGRRDGVFYERLGGVVMEGRAFTGVLADSRKKGMLDSTEKSIAPAKDRDGRIRDFVPASAERAQAEEAIRQSEERFRNVVENAPVCIHTIDRKGRLTSMNRAGMRMLGVESEEQICGMQMLSAVSKPDRERIGRLMQEALQGSPSQFEFTTVSGRIFNSNFIPISNAAGDIRYLLGITEDITERKKADEALRTTAASLAEAQRIAHLGNWEWDISTNNLLCSDEVYRIFGLTPRQIGATYEAFLSSVHPDDRRVVIDAVNQALQERRPCRIDHRIVRPDGSERMVHTQGEVKFDETGKAVRMLGTTLDVTELWQAQERLQYMAHYDALTNLPNRTLLYSRLQQVMRDSNRDERLVAVLFLDLDRFKTVNDTLGHDVGDAMLRDVADRLTACLRPGDTVARLGGDEFGIVLANLRHVDDVTGVAHKILRQFMSPFRLAGRDLFASASLGITLYPLDDKDTISLLRDADVAMYRAKELGGNNFQFYTADLNARAARRLELETGLRQALERQEFVLHYQPLVDTKSGRIRGMEALLRWQHPEFGLIPPLDFIPLAEETGLIIPIGEWVLKTACAQIKAWHDTGFPALQVAVNLSSKQLGDQNLIAAVKQALESAKLPARYLDLELTESVLMRDMELASTFLQELKEIGVCFSLDDFGTGYSSLSYLKHFPIDYLKIDRSFVRDMLVDPVGAGLVKAIVAMAHTLNIKVIAEGVEAYEQLAFLRQEGCDITQGYFCSPPIDAAAFTELLRDWTVLRAGKCRMEEP